MVPYFDLGRQSAVLEPKLLAAIQSVIRDSAFASGPYVKAFEEAFASYLGCSHVVCVNSGTSALHLGLHALNLPQGSEVITTPMSFIATCWGITYAGLRPVFVDIDPSTGLLDLDKVATAVSPRTKAVLPVHLYGNAVNLETLRHVAETHGLQIFEDAAQAHGTRFEGKHVGATFSGGAFSFYPGKSLGAFGEGGAVATNDTQLAERVRTLRDHGSKTRYFHDEIGYNYRMDGIQGAILGVKLHSLNDWIARRRAIAAAYDKGLRELPLAIPSPTLGVEHSYHLYVVLSPERDALAAHLQHHGVGSAKHYPLPIHLQKAYAELGYRRGDFPYAERYAEECLSLPIFPEMSDAEVDSVIGAVRSFYA